MMILRGSWLLVGLWTDWGIPCFLSEPRRGRTYWKGLLAVGTMVSISIVPMNAWSKAAALDSC